MIALALQKKFANQNFHSPEVDKENENHDFSSADENSPHVPVRALLIHQLLNTDLFHLKRWGDTLKIKDNGV